MDDTASKGISLPVTIVLIVIICTIGILLFNKTKPMQKQANIGLDTMNQSLSTKNFNQYDNQTVSGASVVSAINTKASSQVIIHVKTNSGSKDYSSASYNVKDVSDPNYIEENGKFKSTLNKNQNRSVVGITFVQVSSGYYDVYDGTNTGGDDNGDNGTGSNIDLTNLIPENVKENVTINGVTGTLKPASSIDLTNLKPENIKKGITINNITGTLDVSSLGGKNWASGSVTPSSDYKKFYGEEHDFSKSFQYIDVEGINFTPSIILVSQPQEGSNYCYYTLYSKFENPSSIKMFRTNYNLGTSFTNYSISPSQSNISINNSFILPVLSGEYQCNWIAVE